MKKGFTLIELLIVVVIIGVIAAIAVPNLMRAQARAKIGTCKGNCKILFDRIIYISSEESCEPADVTQAQINQEMAGAQFPVCPSEGTYTWTGTNPDLVVIIECDYNGSDAKHGRFDNSGYTEAPDWTAK